MKLVNLASIAVLGITVTAAPTGTEVSTPTSSSSSPSSSPSSTSTSDECADTTVGNLKGVSNKLGDIQEKVENFEHSLLGIGDLLDIQKASDRVGSALDITVDTLSKCKQFDTSPSLDLSQATLDMLPLINTTLNTIVDKKPEFDKAILDLLSASFIVKKDLKSLSEKTDSLSSQIKSHLADDLQPAVENVEKQISGWFEDAIAAYS